MTNTPYQNSVNKHGVTKARKIQAEKGRKGWIKVCKTYFDGDREAMKQFCRAVGRAAVYKKTRPLIAYKAIEPYFELFPNLRKKFTPPPGLYQTGPWLYDSEGEKAAVAPFEYWNRDGFPSKYLAVLTYVDSQNRFLEDNYILTVINTTTGKPILVDTINEWNTEIAEQIAKRILNEFFTD